MKEMPLPEDMNPVRDSEDKRIDVSKEELCQYPHISNGRKNIVEDIVSSYEARIQIIGSIFDTTHQLLEGSRNSFLDTKQERAKINTQIRDILAKNEHLRRKDFDNMMQGILSNQDEREKGVRNLLEGYLNEQKKVAQTLRENLEKFRDFFARDEAQRVKEFQEMIKEILTKQDERKYEVTSKLKEFQKEQQEMAKRLKELLDKGRELRIKDLKLMLKEFKARHKERLACQEKRKKEVRSMLGDFKKERVE
jgi:molecular chaperone DnaK (HSP70)